MGQKVRVFQNLQLEYQKEIIQLRQKARIKWDVEGDCNTRYFHKVIQQRRNTNQINRFIWKGKVLYNPQDIKNGILEGFKDFFCKNQGQSSFILSSLDWYELSSIEVQPLEKPLNIDEVETALQESDSNKSSGPDGFNAGWVKTMWPLICNKVMEFFHKLYSDCLIPRGVNSSFIVLIPKITNPDSFNHFRPISLINSSLRLLLKVLANRLKKCLGKVISVKQSAFLKGRNISDSILMVNEVIHAMRTYRTDGLILNLDFSKAYDSIDWSCLLAVLRCIKLGDKWIRWIEAILLSTRMSILVNGSPTAEFSLSRGIR